MWDTMIKVLLTQGGLAGIMVVALTAALVYVYKQKTASEARYHKSLVDSARECRECQTQTANAQANQWEQIRVLLKEWYETMRHEEADARKASTASNEKVAAALVSVGSSLAILLDRLDRGGK